MLYDEEETYFLQLRDIFVAEAVAISVRRKFGVISDKDIANISSLHLGAKFARNFSIYTLLNVD